MSKPSIAPEFSARYPLVIITTDTEISCRTGSNNCLAIKDAENLETKNGQIVGTVMRPSIESCVTCQRSTL